MTRLPGILGEIEDVVGRDAAVALARAWGGTKVKFSGRPGGALAQVVGDAAASKIAELMGSVPYTVPFGDLRGGRATARARRIEAAKLSAQGKSASEIAQLLDMHERSVFRVRDRQKNRPTLPMFDD